MKVANSYSKITLILFVFLFMAGCGGAPKKSHVKHSGSKSKSKVTYSGDKKGVGGDVATLTKAVTLKRKGSWNLTSDKVKDISSLVTEAAKKNDLPEDLIYGIIWVESRFNPRAVSPVGARGLMQLMPKTADYLGDCINWSGRRNSFDPEFNIAAGSFYIAKLIKNFDGDVDLALAAYNAGPTKIRRWMNSDGLPKVSIEYHTMVQTARGFFGGNGTHSDPSPGKYSPPTNDDLDRLGLAILIAGLSDKEFGLERENDANPFD